MARARREYEALLSVVAEQSAALERLGGGDDAVRSLVARAVTAGKHLETLIERPKVRGEGGAR